jgi:hypothetical protein
MSYNSIEAEFASQDNSHSLKKFPTVYGHLCYITMFMRTFHWLLTQEEAISHPQTIFL